MAGGFSYVSLAPHGHADNRQNRYSYDRQQQLSPNPLHLATSQRSSDDPVSPLESDDGSSIHLDRTVSLATVKSPQLPTVQIYPAIAEERTSPPECHRQPEPYNGQNNETAAPYGLFPTTYSSRQQSTYSEQVQQYYSTNAATFDNTYSSNYPRNDSPFQAQQQKDRQSPFPSRPPSAQTTRPPKIRKYRVFREWKWEIATLVFLFILLIGLGLLLGFQNKKRVPDWGRYINLNTVLALMSTFLRAGLVYILTQIISQRKWTWFAATEDATVHHGSSNRLRPLGHVQRFDEGSRNPFKAIWMFAGVLRGRDLISLGAAVIFLLSFLVGPFVQQASQTESCTESGPGGVANVPNARYVPREGGYVRGYPARLGEATSDTVVALLSTATAPKGIENRVGFACETGNCTFSGLDPVLGGRGEQRDVSGRDSASVDLTLPYLGTTYSPVPKSLTEQSALFLSQTHSTVGICRYCSDISAGINVTAKQNRRDVGSLAGMSVSANPFGVVFNMSSAYGMEDWFGPLLSPEHGMAARYALHNTTMLMVNGADSFLAAACHMYPCLRTYSSAVRSGELLEVESADSTSQQPLKRLERQFWPAKMGTLDDRPATTDMSSSHGVGASWSGQKIFYATIKSPCRATTPVDATVAADINTSPVYTRSNMSSSSAAVDIIMYQPRVLDAVMLPVTSADKGEADLDDYAEADYHWAHYRVPEECIYRHAFNFHTAVGSVLRGSILSGLCRDDPRSGATCDAPIDVVASSIEALYHKGGASMGSIEGWFQDFADAITARYRFQFGAADWAGNTDETAAGRPVLPRGQAQGQVWLTVVCIAMEDRWLQFPLALLLATTLLLAATVFGTWRHRFDRPVWKDSVLPMLFYNGKFSQHGGPVGQQADYGYAGAGQWAMPGGKEGGNDYHQAGGLPGRLLEAREMQRIADQTMVTFDWPGSTNRRWAEPGGEGHATGVLYDSHAQTQASDRPGTMYDGGPQYGTAVSHPRRPFLRMPWHQQLSMDSLLDNSSHR
ncbi:DUF3176 domain-containing protein [Microdochium nivale]|nr:DUF3176 domain-containing protein [Microdochium nivale]